MAKKKKNKDRIQLGVRGVDELFLGGVKEKNIIIVEGAPGTGKTTLGLEYIYRGAKEQKQCGLIISFEMTPQKIISDASGFGWDLAALIRKNKIKIINIGPLTFPQELQKTNSLINTAIKSIDAERIFIDGLTPLKIYSESSGKPYREVLQHLMNNIQEQQVTALITNEVPINEDNQIHLSHEQYISDTVLALTTKIRDRRSHRYFEIKKSRGQDYISGLHTMRITSDIGIEVYRRTQAWPKYFDSRNSTTRRCSTGIRGLDEIMGGGIYDGTITLVAGISGTGKTVMGLQFLTEGALKGENCLHITLDEQPSSIMRNAESLGMTLEQHIKKKRFSILYESPLDLEFDVHLEHIIRFIEDNNIQRVVIDSIATYENVHPKESYHFIFALTSYLKSKMIPAFLHYETPELLGVSQISQELNVSPLVDNIILLSYVEISTQMRRAITVPKMRGTRIPQKTREFIMDEKGIKILEEDHGMVGDVDYVPQLPFSSYYGILSRAPARKSPVIEEKVAHGKELPESTVVS